MTKLHCRKFLTATAVASSPGPSAGDQASAGDPGFMSNVPDPVAE